MNYICESPIFFSVHNPGITNIIQGESEMCEGRNMNKSIFTIGKI